MQKYNHLLNLGEVILRVLIEDELSNWAERELREWPDLGEVENIVVEFLSLLWHHSLQ